MWSKLANFYATNTLFHSLVHGVLFAVLGYVVSLHGGIPSNAAGWAALGSGIAGAVWGVVTQIITGSVLTQQVKLAKQK